MNKIISKRVFGLLILIFVSISSLFCLEYHELLQNYCNQDIQLEELAISYSQAQLSYEQTLVNNGVKLNASTGAIKLEFKDNQVDTSLSPSIGITFPSLSNTEAKISVPISVSNDKLSVPNAGITISTDIISSTTASRNLTIEKATRSLLEAERKLNTRLVNLEKSFLNELKNLYSLGLAVNNAEESLITKTISFESMKLQGYSETSTKYRSSLLAVKTAEFDLEKAKRNYASALESFLLMCNAQEVDILSLEIPDVDLLKITDFPKDKFASIESTQWSNYVNSTARANEKEFTLSASSSYNVSMINDNMSSSFGAGLSAGYRGFAGNVNVAFPSDDKSTPSVSFSLSWNPNQTKLAKISNENTDLDIQKESLSLEKANKEYKETVQEYEIERENLLWQYEKTIEELAMYEELAKDTEYWYNNGIVSASEYRQANTDYAKAKLSVISSKIEKLIYNIDLQSLFVE